MDHLLACLGKAQGIACDSRKVGPGYIFVALVGRATNGNRFVADAVARGADAVVTDCPESLPPLNVPVFAVSNARLVLAELATRFYKHPSRELKLIGVTGTNGKTTVACMLEHIFRLSGRKTGLIGTVAIDVGADRFPSVLTTPDPISLQEYFAAMRQNEVTHAVMEVSAQGLEMHRPHGTRFAGGILTNVTVDHLDFHGDFSTYLAAKARFPELLGDIAPLIINAADPFCRSIAAHARSPVITVALDTPADVVGHVEQLTSRAGRFRFTLTRPVAGCLQADPAPITIRLPLPGRHNIENALLATVAAITQGLTPEVVATALSSFRAVTRRMEVFRLNGLTVIDDTALNPGSIDAVFATIGAFRYRRLIVVNAIRGNRGAAINAANAAALARQNHVRPFTLIITASGGGVGATDRVSAEEQDAFLTALAQARTPCQFFESLPAAINQAVVLSEWGDLLVLLGAQGMDDGFSITRRLLGKCRISRQANGDGEKTARQEMNHAPNVMPAQHLL